MILMEDFRVLPMVGKVMYPLIHSLCPNPLVDLCEACYVAPDLILAPRCKTAPSVQGQSSRLISPSQ